MNRLFKDVIDVSKRWQKAYRRPLGVTGEVGEALLCKKFKLKQARPRQKGYDAKKGKTRIQIKCRVAKARPQRSGKIPQNGYDVILLGLFTDDYKLQDAFVVKRVEAEKKLQSLLKNKSKNSKNKRTLSISQIKSIGTSLRNENGSFSEDLLLA